MPKKRKSENAGLDEVERTLYTSFCTAANSISQLYTQSQHQQKFAFQAGERHCVEKLYQWLQRDYQAGSTISLEEILNYLQNELDGEEMTMSPGPQLQQLLLSQQQHQQHQQQQLLASNNQAPLGAAGYPGLGNAGRTGAAIDQTKISVFTGALSSPNRRSLPQFPIVQGGYGPVSAGNGGRRSAGGTDPHHEDTHEERESPASTQTQPYSAPSLPSQTQSVTSVYGYNPPQGQHREAHGFGESDFSMDMHADGGSDEYYR